MRATLRAASVLAGLSLAGLGCTEYSVRRSALVPHAAPLARSGQPIAAPEVAVSTPRALSVLTPEEGQGANAGLYLPRVQVTGELRLPTGRPDFDIGLLYDHGADDGATAITPDQPRPDGGDVIGAGGSMHWAPELSPGIRLGVGGALLVYSVPFIEYRTALGSAGEPLWTDIERGRKSVLVGQLSVAPSYRVGAVTVFGSLSLRNHPTNTKGEVTTDPFFDDDDEIRNGPIGAIVAAGAELDAGPVRLLVQAFWPVIADPVDYGPTLGLAIAVPLVRRAGP